MTARAGEPSIDELMRHVRQQVEQNDQLRRELAVALWRKDENAVVRVLRGVGRGLKEVAPYLIPILAALFGIPWAGP